MRRALGSLVLVLISGAASAPARTDGCEEAWYQRNIIFKEAGYCFRTPRAIRAFGNAGCRFDDENEVPLSASQRAAVAEFRAYEAANGCPR